MVHVDKTREVVHVIRENEPRWWQGSYATGVVNEDAPTWRECGTSFCGAGWRCALDGLRPVAGNDKLATGQFRDMAGIIRDAYLWAKHSMQLTNVEAELLFVTTAFVRDVDAYEWITEQVIAGRAEWLVRCDVCNAGHFVTDCSTCERRGVVYVSE